MSAGVNQIDVAELKKRGIKLGNTPSVLDNAVADVAVLLTLAAARRLNEGRLKIEKWHFLFYMEVCVYLSFLKQWLEAW